MATTRSRTTDTPKRRAKATTQPAPRRTRKAPAAAAVPPPAAHESIAERAYAIFESEGGGDSLQHWLRAERELAAA